MKKYTFYLGRNVSEGKETIATIKHETIVADIQSLINSATIYNATSFWNGERENVTVIEVIGALTHVKLGHIIDGEAFRQYLEKQYKQDSVLMTVEDIETHF